MKSKRALSLTTSIIIFTALSILVLIFLLSYVTNLLGTSDYQSSIRECSSFYHSVSGKPTYFSNKLDTPTQVFFDGVAEFCPSKKTEYSGQERQVAEAIQNCWIKSGKGVDYFPSFADEQGICMVCGEIEIKKSTSSFSQDLTEELTSKDYNTLFDSSKVTNLNKESLSQEELPTSVSEGERYLIVSYWYKPPIDSTADSIQTWFGQRFSSLGGSATTLTYFVSSSSVPTYAGVRLAKIDTSQGESQILVNGESIDDALSCSVIVPKRSFD